MNESADIGHTPPPPSLAELQRWMTEQIRVPNGPTARQAEAIMHPQRGAPAVERLAVYADGYVERTRQALVEMYPAVRHVVGQRMFAKLARRYSEQYPSRDYNLSLRGRHLPEFLSGDLVAHRLPFLPDLARLERLVSQAFHAFEHPPLDPAALRAVPSDAWDRMRLVLQPSVGVVVSAWPILDIWQARTRPRHEINIDLVHRPQPVLIFRQGLAVRCELVDEPQAALLQDLLSGRTLGAACEALAQGAAASPTTLEPWCLRWQALGLIVRCDVVLGKAVC